MKIWIYWSESNSWIYFYIVLAEKNEKIIGPNKVLLVIFSWKEHSNLKGIFNDDIFTLWFKMELIEYDMVPYILECYTMRITSSINKRNSAVLEMKIWIYWSESNSWIYFYIVLAEKNEKIIGPNKVLLVIFSW
jgi:hypothetical protein